MKQRIWTAILLLGALSPASAVDDKEDVKAAAKKLSDAANYSWTTTIKNNADNQGQGAPRFVPGPIEGKAQKDGLTWLSMKQGENSFEAALKGERFALKFKDMWIGSGDVPGGGQPGRPDPALFASRMMKSMKPASQTVSEAIDKLKDLKAEGEGVYSGEFTPEGAQDQLVPPNRGGQSKISPTVTDAKGTLKLWIKDGSIVKVESTLQGKMSFGQREIEINRTATTEIKDVGSTKIELPEEAKKRLE
ncbi:MAG TPA: hypothetical protein VKU80_14815 [Planctomycetota bacterium]|nr:hypothetical protein [Planctomycetota bacterium]